MFEVLGLAMASQGLELEESSEISSTDESNVTFEPEVEIVEPSEGRSESDPWN